MKMSKKLSKLERFAIKYGLTIYKSDVSRYYESTGFKGLVPRIQGIEYYILEASQWNPESIFIISKDYKSGYHTDSNITEEELRQLAKSIGIDVSYHRLAEVFHEAEISKRKTK